MSHEVHGQNRHRSNLASYQKNLEKVEGAKKPEGMTARAVTRRARRVALKKAKKART